MKTLQKFGFGIFLTGLSLFCALIFLGQYQLTPEKFDKLITEKGIKSELFIANLNANVVNKTFSGPFDFSTKIIAALEEANTIHRKKREWSKVIWDKPHSFSYEVAKKAGIGSIVEHKGMFWLLTFGLGILGSLLYILPNVITLGPPGIKNNDIFLTLVPIEVFWDGSFLFFWLLFMSCYIFSQTTLSIGPIS